MTTFLEQRCELRDLPEREGDEGVEKEGEDFRLPLQFGSTRAQRRRSSSQRRKRRRREAKGEEEGRDEGLVEGRNEEKEENSIREIDKKEEEEEEKEFRKEGFWKRFSAALLTFSPRLLFISSVAISLSLVSSQESARCF